MEIKQYVKLDGSCPYDKWIGSLNIAAKAKVISYVRRIEGGNFSNVKWFKGLGELKIDWGAGYRVYLARNGKEIVLLLGGGTKKNQQSDIAKASECLTEFKARKKLRKSNKKPSGDRNKKKKR